jgi:hypothetical protein
MGSMGSYQTYITSGGINNKNMTDFLLNTKIEQLNNKNIKRNINKIVNKLKEISIDKNRHQYLCLSCIFGAFLGDSIGSSCEFCQPSSNNHKAIFSGNDEVFILEK